MSIEPVPVRSGSTILVVEVATAQADHVTWWLRNRLAGIREVKSVDPARTAKLEALADAVREYVDIPTGESAVYGYDRLEELVRELDR